MRPQRLGLPQWPGHKVQPPPIDRRLSQRGNRVLPGRINSQRHLAFHGHGDEVLKLPKLHDSFITRTMASHLQASEYMPGTMPGAGARDQGLKVPIHVAFDLSGWTFLMP